MALHCSWDKILNSQQWPRKPIWTAWPDFLPPFSVLVLDCTEQMQCFELNAQGKPFFFFSVLGQAEPDNQAETRLYSSSPPDTKFFEFETTPRTLQVHLPGLDHLFPCPPSKLTCHGSHALTFRVPAHFLPVFFLKRSFCLCVSIAEIISGLQFVPWFLTCCSASIS